MPDMKKNRESKAGSSPTANVSFEPERGYGTTEQKEKIEERKR